MTTSSNFLKSCKNHDLAKLCAQQSNLVNREVGAASACYELFRRACIPPFDDAAWQAVYEQYARLVQHWLGQYASADTVQNTFLRFFQAQQDPQLPSLL